MPVDGMGVTAYCKSALILKFPSLPVDGVGITIYCNSALILISLQARELSNYVNNNTFQSKSYSMRARPWFAGRQRFHFKFLFLLLRGVNNVASDLSAVCPFLEVERLF